MYEHQSLDGLVVARKIVRSTTNTTKVLGIDKIASIYGLKRGISFGKLAADADYADPPPKLPKHCALEAPPDQSRHCLKDSACVSAGLLVQAQNKAADNEDRIAAVHSFLYFLRPGPGRFATSQ